MLQQPEKTNSCSRICVKALKYNLLYLKVHYLLKSISMLAIKKYVYFIFPQVIYIYIYIYIYISYYHIATKEIKLLLVTRSQKKLFKDGRWIF